MYRYKIFFTRGDITVDLSRRITGPEDYPALADLIAEVLHLSSTPTVTGYYEVR